MSDEASVSISTEKNFYETIKASEASSWVEDLQTFNQRFLPIRNGDQVWKSAFSELVNEGNNGLSNVQHELTSQNISEQPAKTKKIIEKVFSDRKVVSPNSPFGIILSSLQKGGHEQTAQVAYAAYLKNIKFPLLPLPSGRAGLDSEVTVGLAIAGLYKFGAFVKHDEVHSRITGTQDDLLKKIDAVEKNNERKLNETIASINIKAAAVIKDIEDQSAAQKIKVDKLTETEELLSGSLEKFSGLKSTLLSEITAHKNTTETELNRLRETFKTGLVLQETYKFWNDRYKFHRCWSIVWGITLCVYAAIIILIGSRLVPNLIASFNKPIYETPALMAVTIFFIVLMAIWGGRLLTRCFLEKRSLAEDASERSVLVQTYIALIKEGGITTDDADIVLRALFRVAAASPPLSEPVPTLPHEGLRGFLR